MFKHYKFENNLMDNCSSKAVTLCFYCYHFCFNHWLGKNLTIFTHLFKKLIYETQDNLHQLTTHMSTLIMSHNRFSENENEAGEAHIPRH